MTILINSGQTLTSRITLKRAIKFATIVPLLSASTLLIMGCDEDNDSTPVVPSTPTTPTQPSNPDAGQSVAYSYGVRPFYLVDDMDEGLLKQELLACKSQTPKKTDFSISHRGAPLQFPEHTYDCLLYTSPSPRD